MSEAHVAQIVTHALRERPREACGVVAGRDGVARWVAEMTNATRSSEEYFAEPREQLEVFERIEREGLELMAIYHSHPSGGEGPSQTDLESAFYPDAVYLIVALGGPEPVVAGYTIREREAGVVQIEIKDEGEHGRRHAADRRKA